MPSSPPIRSPSLSSTTSPKWMPTRNSMRRSGGETRIGLDHAVLHLDGAAHCINGASKLNEDATVRLTMRPRRRAMAGSNNGATLRPVLGGLTGGRESRSLECDGSLSAGCGVGSGEYSLASSVITPRQLLAR